MNEVFGTFILTLTNGLYTVEFFNNHLDNFLPENIAVNNINAPFEGIFNTNWQEDNNRYTSELRIIQNNNVYNLILCPAGK
jgi:hypothetical protein